MLGAVVALALGWTLVMWFRRRSARPDPPAADGRAPAGASPPAPPTIEQLQASAEAALVELDTTIMASSSELEAMRAQLDEQSCEPFTASLAEARTSLASALALHRDGPHAGPGSEDEDSDEDAHRAWLEQIMARCQAALEHLDGAVPTFDEVRDLEHHLATLLPALSSRAAELGSELEQTRTTMADLGTRYPEIALAPVRGNLAHAEERLRFVTTSLQAAARTLESSDTRGAAAWARAAEECLGQARLLVEGVQQAPDDLAKAERAVDVLLVATEGGIAEAEALGIPDSLSGTHPFAQHTVDWARGEAGTGSFDPIATRRALEDTGTALEVGLAPRRAAQEARRRAMELLESATDSASSSIRVAGCFITTRRGAVGAEARSRLSRAVDLYHQGVAVAQDDPPAAVADLQQADALADQALQLAQQDEAGVQNDQRMRGVDPLRTSALIGGIICARAPAAERPWAAVSFGGARTRDRWALPGLD